MTAGWRGRLTRIETALAGALKVSLALFGIVIVLSIWSGSISRPKADGPDEGAAQRQAEAGARGDGCDNGAYAVAVARLRAYDAAFSKGDIATLDSLYQPALRDIEQSLACGPTASDLWFGAARLMTLNEGLSQKAESYIAMSCRTGATQFWNADARLKAFSPIASALAQDVQSCLRLDRVVVAAMPQPHPKKRQRPNPRAGSARLPFKPPSLAR